MTDFKQFKTIILNMIFEGLDKDKISTIYGEDTLLRLETLIKSCHKMTSKDIETIAEDLFSNHKSHIKCYAEYEYLLILLRYHLEEERKFIGLANSILPLKGSYYESYRDLWKNL